MNVTPSSEDLAIFFFSFNLIQQLNGEVYCNQSLLIYYLFKRKDIHPRLKYGSYSYRHILHVPSMC